ncbi:hypothetical protein C8Q76DRAFT_752718 [Earliella scabrosa]|nr:hypothetical protein C8Q76DRAFT_752718 [Earliella scabrosa]
MVSRLVSCHHDRLSHLQVAHVHMDPEPTSFEGSTTLQLSDLSITKATREDSDRKPDDCSGATGSSSSGCGPYGSVERIEPPCTCWFHHKDDKANQRPLRSVPLRLAFAPVRSCLLSAVATLNRLLAEAAAICVDSEEGSGPSSGCCPQTLAEDSGFTTTLADRRKSILTNIEVAIITTGMIPGYVCSPESRPHNQLYSGQEFILRNMQENLEAASETLNEAHLLRDEVTVIDRSLRRRKYIQGAVRAASIVAVPYAPLVAALITVLDFFAVSIPTAIQVASLPENLESLRERAADIGDLEENVNVKMKMVEETWAHLQALKAAVEEQQKHPNAPRLFELMVCLYTAQRAVEGALASRCGECEREHEKSAASAAPGMREIVAAFRDLAATLDAPEAITGSMASLTEAQCDALDRTLAPYKTALEPDPKVES